MEADWMVVCMVMCVYVQKKKNRCSRLICAGNDVDGRINESFRRFIRDGDVYRMLYDDVIQ